MLKLLAILVALSGVVVYFYTSFSGTPATIPVLPDVIWKRDSGPIEDEKIYPFSIETSREVSTYLAVGHVAPCPSCRSLKSYPIIMITIFSRVLVQEKSTDKYRKNTRTKKWNVIVLNRSRSEFIFRTLTVRRRRCNRKSKQTNTDT